MWEPKKVKYHQVHQEGEEAKLKSRVVAFACEGHKTGEGVSGGPG